MGKVRRAVLPVAHLLIIYRRLRYYLSNLFRVCVLVASIFPQNLNGCTSPRVPSPDPAPASKASRSCFTSPSNLPAASQTRLRSTVPGTSAARPASPTVCIASRSRRIPRATPPRHTVVTHQYPRAVSIKSPSGCSIHSCLCLVVWVVPAVHSRPPGFPGYHPWRLAGP